MPTTTKKAAKSTKKAAVPKTLTVTSGRNAKLPTIMKDLRTALGKIGCGACRSGIDKIIIQDKVINRVQ